MLLLVCLPMLGLIPMDPASTTADPNSDSTHADVSSNANIDTTTNANADAGNTIEKPDDATKTNHHRHNVNEETLNGETKGTSETEKAENKTETKDTDVSTTTLIHLPPKITQFWPRPSTGPTFHALPYGIQAPNAHHLWGATPVDFYRTNRVPQIEAYVTTTTGSRMARWCKEIGEVGEWNEAQMHRAEVERREEAPTKKAWVDLRKIFGNEDTKRVPFKSIDSKSEPWPSDKPYSIQQPIPLHLLPEKLIVHDPYRVLRANGHPKYKHDFEAPPSSTCSYGDPFSKEHDLVHIYRLQLIPEVKEEVKRIRTGIKQRFEEKWKPIELLRLEADTENASYSGSDTSGSTSPTTSSDSSGSPTSTKPNSLFDVSIDSPSLSNPTLVKIPVLVPPPNPTNAPTIFSNSELANSPPYRTPSAHLYLSAGLENKVGTGNHSYVWRVELDLDRRVFEYMDTDWEEFDPEVAVGDTEKGWKICEECVRAEAEKMLAERRENLKARAEEEAQQQKKNEEANNNGVDAPTAVASNYSDSGSSVACLTEDDNAKSNEDAKSKADTGSEIPDRIAPEPAVTVEELTNDAQTRTEEKPDTSLSVVDANDVEKFNCVIPTPTPAVGNATAIVCSGNNSTPNPAPESVTTAADVEHASSTPDANRVTQSDNQEELGSDTPTTSTAAADAQSFGENDSAPVPVPESTTTTVDSEVGTKASTSDAAKILAQNETQTESQPKPKLDPIGTNSPTSNEKEKDKDKGLYAPILVKNVPWYRPSVDPVPCACVQCHVPESTAPPPLQSLSNTDVVPSSPPPSISSPSPSPSTTTPQTQPQTLPPNSPPTYPLSLITKLSIQGDDHLVRESRNYQRFPKWMSEHWTGFNIAYPVHEMTKCGAIVPSWFGYYVREGWAEEEEEDEEETGDTKGQGQGDMEKKVEEEAQGHGDDVKEQGKLEESEVKKEGKGDADGGEKEREELEEGEVKEKTDPDGGDKQPQSKPSAADLVKEWKRKRKEERAKTKECLQWSYWSPIMLLEDCGTQIDRDFLDEEDKYECAALLTRLHHHGWVHGSFYPRNIVMTYGDHSLYPAERSRAIEQARQARRARRSGEDPDAVAKLPNGDNQRRFRLIDFGRAKWIADYSYRNPEGIVRKKDEEAAKKERQKVVRRERGRAFAEEIGKVAPDAWDEWDKERFEEKHDIYSVVGALV
ncbi:hypothetical protein VKT23_015453 [Stygiomarasmius scandens]|uniref:Protein kinase domain-containing protein n=1 Tax=Marasmiellus scandens TaxID=2682957 RepID=A0ABR1J277_9AGAR